MRRKIILRGHDDVEDIFELNRLTDGLVIVDEVYRAMSRPDIVESLSSIDFRRREYREIPGAQLKGFRVRSPAEIVINVDNVWIGALAFVLVHYKTAKENIQEIAVDTSDFLNAIGGLADQEIRNIQIGLDLFFNALLTMSQKELESLFRRVRSAGAKLAHHQLSVESEASFSPEKKRQD